MREPKRVQIMEINKYYLHHLGFDACLIIF